MIRQPLLDIEQALLQLSSFIDQASESLVAISLETHPVPSFKQLPITDEAINADLETVRTFMNILVMNSNCEDCEDAPYNERELITGIPEVSLGFSNSSSIEFRQDSNSQDVKFTEKELNSKIKSYASELQGALLETL